LRVLGRDGRPCTFEPRLARILAVLLLSPNQVVARDYLIDAVWDDAPPATAGRQLQNCISHLRHLLPDPDERDHLITAEPAGYRINLESSQLDAAVFEVRVALARRQQAADRIAESAAMLRDALSLWYGPALAGLTGRIIEAARTRLDELRLTTLEDCLDLELHQGRHHHLIVELLELVSAHPLREPMVGLLMRALYGTGRQSEALQAYDRLRERLADELGLDPGIALQELRTSILRSAVPVVVASSPADDAPTVPIGATALRQLPAPGRHFVGREAALAELDQLAAAVGRDAVVIALLHGTGGIGKTALAVRWAHQAAAKFPDGQLFVNLRGFDPTREPMSPTEAVRGFLDAFAIPAGRIPVDVEAQASLYRTLLAERRLLIVLDNARDADQVRPLLPGSFGCMVIVTCRNELTGLVALDGAYPIALDVLGRDEARDLLASHLGAPRLANEPKPVDELVGRCAGLPLALGIIAARAAAHPTFPLATFSAELADTQRRLDAINGGEESSQVRSVFSWSYKRLPTRAARLFRLLGLYRGPDVTVPAAANLAGIELGEARQLLTELARAHMVTEHRNGRYAFHDLVGTYATELAHTYDSEADRKSAVRRLLGFDLHAAAAADVLVAPHRRRTPLLNQPPVGLPPFRDHAGALAWLEGERGNLVAAVQLAYDHKAYDMGWRLANLLWGLFNLEKHWDDWIGTHRIGLACAEACGDLRAEFTMSSSLGTAYRERREFEDALRCHERALAVSREIGDRHGEGQALNGLGSVYGDMAQPAQARHYYVHALEIRREVGDRWGEAITICNLGEQDLNDGRLEPARENFVAALELRRQIGDRWGEAMALNYLGQAYRADARHEEAGHFLSQALAIHRQLSDYSMEALDLHHLGLTYRSLGQADLGERYLREALAIYQRLGMPAADEVERHLAEPG
jgi:DNA-binding SARP family transcriptional activator